MIYINAFLVCGFICALAQVICEYTFLTPGDVNVLLVILGSLLAFLGIYDKLIIISGAGASAPITNFGYLIYKGAYEGYLTGGLSGLLKGTLSYVSGGISFTIVFGFISGVLSKPRH